MKTDLSFTSSIPPKATQRLVWFVGILLLNAVLAVWLLPASTLHRYLPWARPKVSEQTRLIFEEKTGVRIVRISVTAGGGMIDLRYQVIDPDKAALVHSPDDPPAIIDEASGRELKTPWMNHVHTGRFRSGVTYYTLFMNSGGQVKPGSLVTVRIGGISIEHLVVQ